MELSQVEDISNIIGKKLQWSAKQEKKLAELEEQELNDISSLTDDYAETNTETNAKSTHKIGFFVGGVALLLGCVLVLRKKVTNAK